MATRSETFHMIMSAEDRATAIFGKVGQSLTGLTGIATGVFSTAALIGFAKQVVDLAGNLSDLSAQTGISAQTLSGIKSTLEENGTSVEAFAKGVFTAQRNIGQASTETRAAVRDLGLDLRQLSTASPEEFLQTIASALAKIEDPIQRNALGAALLGRSFKELSPALSEIAGKFEELRSKGMKEEDIRRLDEFGDAMTRLKNKLLIFSAGAAFDIGKMIGLADLTRIEQLGRAEIAVDKLTAAVARATGKSAADIENSSIAQLIKLTEKAPPAVTAAVSALVNARNKVDEILAKPAEGAKGPAPLNAAQKQIQAQTTAITNTLNVLKDRVNEAFKTGVAPSTEEFQRMFETLAQAQAKARQISGADLPTGIRQSLSETRQFIQELAAAGKIDLSAIIKNVPAELSLVTSTTRGFGTIWDSATGEIIASLEDMDVGVGEFKGVITDSKDVLFELNEKANELPQTLEQWKSPITDTITLFTSVKGEIKTIMSDLKVIPGLINDINARGGVKLFATNIEEVLKRQRLATNSPE